MELLSTSIARCVSVAKISGFLLLSTNCSNWNRFGTLIRLRQLTFMTTNFLRVIQRLSLSVTAGPAGAIMSPYLNFDPSYIGSNADSQFIFPEGAARVRGRLELSFSQIGGSVFLGAAVGGLNGFYSGMKDVQARQLVGANRRTQMLNFITKGGASTAQTLGVVALMYSVFGVVLSWGRGVDDELNTVTAGTATGMLYKSSAGLKRCLRGGAIGFGLSAVYVLFTSRDRIRGMVGR